MGPLLCLGPASWSMKRGMSSGQIQSSRRKWPQGPELRRPVFNCHLFSARTSSTSASCFFDFHLILSTNCVNFAPQFQLFQLISTRKLGPKAAGARLWPAESIKVGQYQVLEVQEDSISNALEANRWQMAPNGRPQTRASCFECLSSNGWPEDLLVARRLGPVERADWID